jgi:lysyl-tRNA synthetase class 2
MNEVPLESSTIEVVGYDDIDMTLQVGFRNGAVYQYHDVPQSVYRDFMAAASWDEFLRANIMNHYRCERLPKRRGGS